MQSLLVLSVLTLALSTALASAPAKGTASKRPTAGKPAAGKPAAGKPAAGKPAPAGTRRKAGKPAAAPKKLAPANASPAPRKPPAPVSAAPKTAGPAGYVLRGPIQLELLAGQKRAVLTHGTVSGGNLRHLSDGNSHSTVRFQGTTASIQVLFHEPKTVEAVDLVPGGEGSCTWSLSAADTASDMASRGGSYRVLAAARPAKAGEMDQAVFSQPRAYRVYRLELGRPDGAEGHPGEIEIAEWLLWAPQALTRLEVGAFAPNVTRGEVLQLQAIGRFEDGARENMTVAPGWEVHPASRGRVDGRGRFEALEPGPARVVAIRHGVRSRPFELDVLAEGKPDWNVTYIERNPRIDFEGPGRGLTPGQTVYWFAHVKNYGTANAAPVPIEWRVDGKTVATGRLPKLERFNQTEALFALKWDGEPHQLEFVVDPGNEVAETSERNNSVKVDTEAVPVGFWVEDSVLRYFHQHQRELEIGSNSWEDWAQRHIAALNESGGGPRRRLDRIIVVGDGMLPLSPGGEPVTAPDPRDRSLHTVRGFPASALAGDLYRRTAERSEENPFFLFRPLIEALRSAGEGGPMSNGDS